MQVFLVQGIEWDDFVYLIDEAIKDNESEQYPVYIVGASETLDIQCYISEIGRHYEGAQALAMFIDMRRKQLSDAKSK